MDFCERGGFQVGLGESARNLCRGGRLRDSFCDSPWLWVWSDVQELWWGVMDFYGSGWISCGFHVDSMHFDDPHGAGYGWICKEYVGLP